MKTERLIRILSYNLEPVKRIEMPLRSALKWLIVSFCAIGILVFYRSDYFRNIHFPVYSYEFLFVILLSVISLLSAIRVSVPGNFSGKEKWITMSGLMLWPFLILIRLQFTENIDPGGFQLGYNQCVTDLYTFSLIPFFYLLLITRRGAVLEPGSAMFLTGVGSLSIAAAGIQLLCPNEAPLHLLQSHFLPVPMVSVGVIIFGKFLFRW